MNVLIYLVPLALLLGFTGLVASVKYNLSR